MKVLWLQTCLFLLISTIVTTVPIYTYRCGFTQGVKTAWEEFDNDKKISSGHFAVVSLFEGGEPCSVLYVEKNPDTGGQRHIMIRKKGCGAHWLIPANQEITLKNPIFSSKADAIKDLWQ